MKRLLLIVLPCLLFAFPATAGDLKDEIIAANAKFMAVFAENPSALAELYTEGGQVLVHNAPPIEGREAIAQTWQGISESGIANIDLTTLEVDGSGDRAVEVGGYALTTGDGSVADTGRYIVIWHRVDGNWMLHRDMVSSNGPATE